MDDMTPEEIEAVAEAFDGMAWHAAPPDWHVNVGDHLVLIAPCKHESVARAACDVTRAIRQLRRECDEYRREITEALDALCTAKIYRRTAMAYAKKANARARELADVADEAETGAALDEMKRGRDAARRGLAEAMDMLLTVKTERDEFLARYENAEDGLRDAASDAESLRRRVHDLTTAAGATADVVQGEATWRERAMVAEAALMKARADLRGVIICIKDTGPPAGTIERWDLLMDKLNAEVNDG